MLNPRNITARVLLVLVGVFGATACSGDDIRWTEEVRLHDGKVIQLKRRAELTSSGFPVQRRGRPRYQEFCDPGLGVHWKSKPVYRPELFDIVAGRAYVKVPLTGCTECMLHRYPASDALYFASDGAGWRSIEEKEFPPGLRFNLLQNAYFNDNGKGDARGLVTLAEKERRDAAIHIELKASGRDSPFPRGECQRCKSVAVQTDETAEVFIPSQNQSCNW